MAESSASIDTDKYTFMGGADFPFAGDSRLQRQPSFAIALVSPLKLGEVCFGEVHCLGAVVTDDRLEKLGFAGLNHQRGLGLKGLAAVLEDDPACPNT